MKVRDFVKELLPLAPSLTELENWGVVGDDVSVILRGYHVDWVGRDAPFSDQLVELVFQYDASALEVGQFSFLGEAVEFGDFLIVGTIGSDWLAFDTLNGSVVGIHDDTGEVMFRLADNGEKFLDVLIAFLRHVKRQFVEFDRPTSDNENEEVMCRAAQECARLASDEDLLDVYKWLFGCFK